MDEEQQEQEQEEQTDNNESELQPLKILYIYKKLDQLNQELIQHGQDNSDIQFFLNYMSNLSYDTIITVVSNLIEKYKTQLKQVNNTI